MIDIHERFKKGTEENNRVVQQMQSPAKALLKCIMKLPYAVAPKKSLEELIGKYKKFFIQVFDKHIFILDACAETGIIRISTKVAEVIWAMSLACILNYEQRRDNSIKLNIENKTPSSSRNPELKKAHNLLAWAVETYLMEDATPWPHDLPFPDDTAEKGSSNFCASELARRTLGFVLWHEIMHIDHNHSESNIENEKDADASASRWIMEDIDPEDSNYKARGMSIVIAMMLTVFQSIYTGSRGDDTHPLPIDRLIHTTRQYFDPNEFFIWEFCAYCMGLFADNVIPDFNGFDTIFSSTYDSAQSYAELIDKHTIRMQQSESYREKVSKFLNKKNSNSRAEPE